MVWGPNWGTFLLWGVLSLTDGIDGWVARRQGTTRSGAFLDPLADKVVVLGALVALVAKHIVWWLPVAIIAVREIGMSIYRSVVGRRGVSIPARTTAKVKTVLQDLAIALCLVPPLADHKALLATGIWVATAMTVFTGAQYFLDGRRAGRAAPGPAPAGPAEGLTARADRDRGGRNRAPARSDRRHQLGVAGRAPGRRRGGLPLPPGGGGQPRPHRPGLPHRPGPERRGHRLRGPRAHPRRHHPGGHRRGDERARSTATRRWWTAIRTMFATREPGDARLQPPPGRRPRRGVTSSRRPRAPPPGSSARWGTR